jgi:hypothetical protein
MNVEMAQIQLYEKIYSELDDKLHISASHFFLTEAAMTKA